MSRIVFEVGTEAIPAAYLPPALKHLEAAARSGLSDLRLSYRELKCWGTPFRLVIIIDEVSEKQADETRRVRGPRADIAFNDGEPTPAAQGFARKNGVDVSALRTVDTGNGVFVEAEVHDQGKPVADVLPGFLEALVRGVPWPKTMRWESRGFLFPRPVRWVLAMLDEAVIPLTIAGLNAGSITRGHRLSGAGEISVSDARSFEDALRDAGVVLDPAVRAQRILTQLQAAAPSGGQALADEALVEEVTFLTEQPTVYSGSFDQEFLKLPKEILVTAMRAHQRYFAVEKSGGDLDASFLVVCDGVWDNPGTVLAGNERVLRARLADARFYWEVDNKRGLEAMAGDLSSVVWLEALGSLEEKSIRVAKLMEYLGGRLFPKEWPGLKDAAMRAAKLAKADLSSEMIKDGKEFTGLQGVIGARYAQAAGEPGAVSAALEEQYLPRGSGDPLPKSPTGELLALADRMDTIAGCWAAGLIPSGSQDPYALRRAGNGILRILLENGRDLDLGVCVDTAVKMLPASVQRDGLAGEIVDFLKERAAYFLGELGFRYDTVSSVLGAGALNPVDARSRAAALEALRSDADLDRLVIAFKRAANILKGVDASTLPDPAALDWKGAAGVEIALRDELARAGKEAVAAAQAGDHTRMLAALLSLGSPIDAFFDEVMVMAEDETERRRRLSLLAGVRSAFHDACDLTRIVVEGEAAKA